MRLDLADLWSPLEVGTVFTFGIYQHNDSTHHPEEGSGGEVCILLYSGQDTED